MIWLYLTVNALLSHGYVVLDYSINKKITWFFYFFATLTVLFLMQLPAGDVMVFLIIAYSGQFDAILIMLSFLLAKGILVFILIKRKNFATLWYCKY